MLQHMNTFTLILKEDISCLTLLTTIYRDLMNQISLVTMRARVTSSNIVQSSIPKSKRFHSLSLYHVPFKLG
jgi:hypothetical protein